MITFQLHCLCTFEDTLRERDVCTRVAHTGASNTGAFAALFVAYELQFRFLALLLYLGKHTKKYTNWFPPTDGVACPVQVLQELHVRVRRSGVRGQW